MISNNASGQDCVLVFPGGGVLADGHGHLGLLSSNFVCHKVREFYQSGRRDFSIWGTQIHNEMKVKFVESDPNGCLDKYGVPTRICDSIRGGTTMTAAFYDDKTITFINLGDSKGYIFIKQGDLCIATHSTVDHTPFCFPEYKRIEDLRKGGKDVGKMMYSLKNGGLLPIYGDDGEEIDYFSEYKNVYESTMKYHISTSELKLDPTNAEKQAEQDKWLDIWMKSDQIYKKSVNYVNHSRLEMHTAKGEYSGYLVGPRHTRHGNETTISCTRTIGDYYGHQVGLCTDMEIQVIPISELPVSDKRVIFVASDGVHDCYTEEELAKIVLTTESDDELLSKFVQKSKDLFGKKQHDDISFFREFLS